MNLAMMKLLTLTALAASASASQQLYSTYSFNPLHHLAGIAPYFEPQDPEVQPTPPQGCAPTRVAYLVRHAAIYSNDFDAESYLEPLSAKLANHTSIDWAHIPPLAFLANWSSPINPAEEELLTRTGKLEAATLGVQLSFRYPNLRLPRNIWASSAKRTVASAKSFARALESDDNEIGVTSIYESKQAGADSLTPYSSCPAYKSSAGSEQASGYISKFTAPIIARLNAAAPAFNWTSNDVYGAFEMCGYESVIRGSSPWCHVFAPAEWLQFEYANDIMYAYNTGYSNPVSGVIGLPWLNATAEMLLAPPNSTAAGQDMTVSFVHRELPPTVLVAMGLFNNSAYSGADAPNDTMPLDSINFQRVWRSSRILPFLTNIGVERLQCTGSYGFADGEYYRVLVNRAPQALPGCSDGPGAGTSCSRATFERYLGERSAMFGGFSDKCGVKYSNSTDALGIYQQQAGNGTHVGRRYVAYP